MRHYLGVDTYVVEEGFGIRICYEYQTIYLPNHEVEKLRKYLNGMEKAIIN